ncbi:MAG: invasion associated locus B family protein [Rhodospirillales bacterium]
MITERSLWPCLVILVLLFSAAASSSRARLIETFSEWSAFTATENGKKYCYMGSKPTEEKGDYRRRGETYILVTHRPAEKTRDEVSIRGGYTYKSESDVEVAIGGQRFRLFTDGDHAWAYDKESDRALTRAMRYGITMIVTGISS